MQAAKLILPRKLTKRIQIVSHEQVRVRFFISIGLLLTQIQQGLIHETYLLEKYGGKATHEEAEFDKAEEALFAKETEVRKVWKARRKQIRAWQRANAAATAASTETK